jgi:hypothetical protein
MIFNAIATLVIALTLYTSYKDFKKDSSLLRTVYLTRPLDYLWSLLIVIGVMSAVIAFTSVTLPHFMTWSWYSLLDSNDSRGNIMLAPLASRSLVIIAIFFLMLSLALPYLAKSEEKMFRSLVFGTRARIIASLKFGLAHMIMGVPLYGALVLSLVGYLFSVFYVKAFVTASKINPYTADEVALNTSTSIHAKYNFIILAIGSLVAMLTLN